MVGDGTGLLRHAKFFAVVFQLFEGFEHEFLVDTVDIGIEHLVVDADLVFQCPGSKERLVGCFVAGDRVEALEDELHIIGKWNVDKHAIEVAGLVLGAELHPYRLVTYQDAVTVFVSYDIYHLTFL